MKLALAFYFRASNATERRPLPDAFVLVGFISVYNDKNALTIIVEPLT